MPIKIVGSKDKGAGLVLSCISIFSFSFEDFFLFLFPFLENCHFSFSLAIRSFFYSDSFYHVSFFFLHFFFLGPVVQSIVSLTSSLRGQLVKCFMTL